MALAMTTPSTRISGLLPGMGFQAIIQLVWDNSYSFGGEAQSLATVFPNEVYGGTVISDTPNDGGYLCKCVRNGGDPASTVFQVYRKAGSGAVGAVGAFTEAATAADLSAMNGQLWMMWGR